MPKPLFLHRPAGLYVRFRVPSDLLRAIGSRFLVRPLKMVKGDRARLVAECMAVALSESFERLRQGKVVDLERRWMQPRVREVGTSLSVRYHCRTAPFSGTCRLILTRTPASFRP